MSKVQPQKNFIKHDQVNYTITSVIGSVLHVQHMGGSHKNSIVKIPTQLEMFPKITKQFCKQAGI